MIFHDYHGNVIARQYVERAQPAKGFGHLAPHGEFPQWYYHVGWNDAFGKEATAVRSDLDVYPRYNLRTLPEIILDFVRLNDGTYGVRLRGNLTVGIIDQHTRGMLY